MAKRKKGGRNRGKAVLQLARAHERLANARRDSLHKIAHRLVAGADVIALEALTLRAMTRSAKGTLEQPGSNVAAKAGLNQALLDASFGLLHRLKRGRATPFLLLPVRIDAILVSFWLNGKGQHP